jgi:hypothetical protein
VVYVCRGGSVALSLCLALFLCPPHFPVCLPVQSLLVVGGCVCCREGWIVSDVTLLWL